MPSGITQRDSMAYVGRQPWHNLGTYVEGDAMTAEQAIESASLDWDVATVPVARPVWAGGDFSDFSRPTWEEIPNRKAVIRTDTQEIFELVSDKYQPIQNAEAFKFFDAIVGTGDAVYHTVGSLFGGRRVWILAKINGQYTLDNGEKLESYILLDNSHDGNSSLRMRLTAVRVVCANTLSSATSSKAQFSARHTSGILDKVSEARDLLGLNEAYMQRFMEQCNSVASEAFDSEQMERLIYKTLNLNPTKNPQDQRSASKRVGADLLDSLYQSGTGNSGRTRWDAFNAVTEYLDYHKGGRTVESIGSEDDATVSKRLNSSWFGKGQSLRGKVWDILQKPEAEMDKVLAKPNYAETTA